MINLMKMQDFQEKRRFVRFEAPFCAECSQPDLEKDLSGVIKDISLSGACLLVDAESALAVDKPLYLSLIFPRTTLRVKTKLVWQKKAADKSKIGVIFNYPSDSLKDDIYEQILKYYPDKMTSRWWDF